MSHPLSVVDITGVPAEGGELVTQDPGLGRAALALLALGVDHAAEVLRLLPEEQAERLTAQMAQLGNVDAQVLDAVASELVVQAGGDVVQGGINYTREVLERVVGTERAGELIERFLGAEVKPFDFMRSMSAEEIAELLDGESPQTIALVAGNVKPGLSGRILDLLGQPLPLVGAQFGYPAPDYHAGYATSFPCPIQFGARRNAFGFTVDWLEHRLPLADPVTHHEMRERCRLLNSEFTANQAWVTRARQLLAAQLPAAPGLEELARQMRCSPRTLRRRLSEAGTSYQALLDGVRYERARQLLERERLPIHRIAEAMGYSETASFRHAFQRWSGVSPRQFRAY